MSEEEKLLSVEATKPGIAQKPLTGTVSAVKLFLGQPLSAWKKAYPSGKPTILNPFAYNFRTGRFSINVLFDKGSELATQATVAAAEGKTPMTVKEATQIASSIGLANPAKDIEDPSYLNWNKDIDRIFAEFGTDKDDRSLTIYVKK